MKVECIKKTVDLNKIHWAISCFKKHHEWNSPSYIVMSYETKAELVNEYYFETAIRDSLNNWGKEGRLFDIPVAINQGLKLGEVDIV